MGQSYRPPRMVPPATEDAPATQRHEAAEIKAGTRKPMIVNEVAIFYTDKEKLPAAVVAEEETPF